MLFRLVELVSDDDAWELKGEETRGRNRRRPIGIQRQRIGRTCVGPSDAKKRRGSFWGHMATIGDEKMLAEVSAARCPTVSMQNVSRIRVAKLLAEVCGSMWHD